MTDAPVGEQRRTSAGPQQARLLWLAAAALAVAGLLVLVAEPLTAALADRLPLAWTVTSAGTQYPSFSDAFPTIALGLAVTLVVAVATAPLLARLSPDDRGFRIVLGALAITAAGYYAWLAYPHNAYPSNSRIHWVDIFHDRTDDYYYTLVKLPHLLFYGAPWLLQALNGATNVVLTGLVTRRVTGRRSAALGAAATFLVSSQLLRFADSAEDLQLSTTALLLLALAYVARRPAWTGVALFVTVLARPTFLVAVGAVGLAELLTAGPRGASPSERVRAALANRFMWTAVGVFGGLFAAWTVWQHLFADPWLLTNGRVIDRATLDVTPREIDGYTIAPYDGVYVGHLAWLIPLPLWAAIAWVCARLPRMERRTRRFLVFAVSFVVVSTFMNETIIVLYWNIRYATYVVPFLILIAWTWPAAWSPRNRIVAAAVGVVLVGSMASPPHVELGVRERVLSDPLTQTVADGHELREMADGTRIATTFTRRSSSNFLAYLFRRPFSQILVLDEGETAPPDTLVVTDDETLVDGELEYEGDGLVIVRTGDG